MRRDSRRQARRPHRRRQRPARPAATRSVAEIAKFAGGLPVKRVVRRRGRTPNLRGLEGRGQQARDPADPAVRRDTTGKNATEQRDDHRRDGPALRRDRFDGVRAGLLATATSPGWRARIRESGVEGLRLRGAQDARGVRRRACDRFVYIGRAPRPTTRRRPATSRRRARKLGAKELRGDAKLMQPLPPRHRGRLRRRGLGQPGRRRVPHRQAVAGLRPAHLGLLQAGRPGHRDRPASRSSAPAGEGRGSLIRIREKRKR